MITNEAELSEKLLSTEKKKRIFFVLALLFGAAFTIALIVADEDSYIPVLLLIPPLIFGSLYAWHWYQLTVFISNNVTRCVLASTFELIEFDADDCIKSELLRKAMTTFKWHNCIGFNYIKAKHRGVEFMFSDIELSTNDFLTTGRTRDDRTVEFVGQYLVITLSREINPPVIVTEPFIANIFPRFPSDMDFIETENTVFNDRFWIISADAHTAFLVLTPHFMEFILSAREIADDRKHMCFNGRQIHILIDTGRFSFEPCSKAKDIPAHRASIQREVDTIKAIIDEFMLNRRLFDAQ
jgi:hypothetical protein